MSDLTEFELYAVARIKGLQKELAEHKKEVTKLQAELSESTPCDIPWIPSVGEECLVTFIGSTPEKCKVLALHQGQAAVSTGRQVIAVDAAQLTQAEGAENAKG